MISAERVSEIRGYVEFGDDEAALLAAFHDLAAPDFERIARQFYERIREHEEAHAVFTGEAQIERLHRSLLGWLHRLLGGVYDAAYYAQTAKIGQVHVRIGLAQRYMFTAMALIRGELEALAHARVPGGGAKTARAISKAVDLELAVMLESYRDAQMDRLTRLQALEREQLAESLALSEHRHMTAVELARELVVGLDAAGSIKLFNAGAERVTGYGREEVIGTSFAERMLPADVVPLFDFALNGAKFEASEGEDALTRSRSVELPLCTRSGNLRDVRWQIARTAAADASGISVFVIGHDQTDERSLAERTRRSEKLAAIGTLAAGLAHEIRNPLNGARLHLEFLSRSLGKTGASREALEAVGIVGDEIQRLASLVTDFLDFARPRALDYEEVSVGALFDRVLPLVSAMAASSGVELTRELPAKVLVFPADRAKMEQVLLNLVMNAIEALAPSGGHVTLRGLRAPRLAIIEVEDDGPGLSSPEAPIFDAFYSTKAQGTGLGLSITHRIVTDHGGSVDVSRREGHTVFRISMPVRA